MRRMLGGCLVVLVLGACASDGRGDAFDGYFLDDGTSAIFLQWNEHDSDVAGTISIASLADDGQSVEHKSASFEGFVEGKDVTLTFAQGLGISTNWIGVRSGDELSVTFSDDEGRLQKFTMRKGDLDDFDTSVAALEAMADGAALSAAENEAKAAQSAAKDAQAQADAAAEVKRVAQVASDKAAIRQGLDEVRTALASVEDALDRVRQDAAVEPMDSYQADTVGFSADSVGFARDSVGFELDDVESAFTRLQALADDSVVEEIRPLVEEARGLMATAEDRVSEAKAIASDARSRAGG